jgi:hypothetical protein
MYSIIRMWQNGARRVIQTGLTLEQAEAHCRDPQTSSRTCTDKAGRQRTRRTGAWFDGFTDEKNPKGRRAFR